MKNKVNPFKKKQPPNPKSQISRSMNTRVLIILGDTKMTGPVKGILQLVKTLKETKPGQYSLVNCLVSEVCSKELSEEFIENNIQVLEIRHKRRDYINLFKKLKRHISNSNINIIQTHGYKQTFLGFLLKITLKVKWICFLHGTTDENFAAKLYHRLDSYLQIFADRTVIVSESQRGKIFRGNNPQRVKIIHNGVDLNNPARGQGTESTTKKILPKVSSFLITVIGRLSPEKGVDIFLEAFAILVKQRPRCHAVIVGDGPELENLLGLRHKLGLIDFVSFMGYTKIPRNFIEATDVIVIPSRSEGIPNVALESMALRKTVIATKVGGVPEIIEDNVNGILIRPEAPLDLANAIIALYDNPQQLKKMSEGGFRQIKTHFSHTKRADKIYSLYQEILV